jgi:hypothetical protein
VQELEDSDTADQSIPVGDTKTVDALRSQAEQLTGLLGRYARTLTNMLPGLANRRPDAKP